MTVIKNTILARFDLGHVDIDKSDGSGRVEEYLELAGVRTRTGAVDLATQRLKILKTDRTTLAFTGQVRDGSQALGFGFQIGDKLGGNTLASVNISVDVDGKIQTVPELGEPIYLTEEALARKIARIAAGITSEYAAPNRDSQDEGTGTDTTPPAFSQSDLLTITLSPVWVAPRPYWLSWLEIAVETVGSANVVVQVIKVFPSGNRVLGTATIAPGDTRAVATVNEGLKTGEKIVMYVAQTGATAMNLTATPRGTMV